MQLINSTSFSIGKAVFIFSVAYMCALFGVQEASAQTNYVVDLSGNGCGNNCADFYNYLANQGVTISNGNSNTQGNPVLTNSGTNSSQYPNYQYTPFPTTDAYYRNNTSAYGTTYGGNRTNAGSGTYNYVQYPYYQYAYFKDPTPTYDSYLAGTYPERFYVYYGKSASDQLSKYQKPFTQVNVGTNTGGTSTGGFTITSIVR